MWSIFPPLEVSQTLRLVLFGCLPSPPWWLKIHSTLQGRERRRERSLHLIGVLEGRKASFQMLSEQSPGMWGQQHLEVFKHSSAGCVLPLLSEEQEAASCHFPSCHFQDQHLCSFFHQLLLCSSCSADRWYQSSFHDLPHTALRLAPSLPNSNEICCVLPS